ncbi:NAD(P)-dependent alcohol dehydrogenase [Anaerolineae bacterium CFX7]|nr:NAD(P)-dependent alcohol dehydrogenase [Anaerolineae bacterium CFX7]
MKAIVHKKYGTPDVLEIQQVDMPTPKEDEVLVRVHASSVNIAQWYGMTGLFIARVGNGLFKPQDTRLGSDFAGVVEQVGKEVRDFMPGDRVFGGRHGAIAEYVTVSKGIAPMPSNATFEQAAALATAGITALQGLRDYGKIQPGQNVVINGASGGVGSFAVQIAKAFGAQVTAVCSTRHVESARALSADYVFDYTKQDFTRSRNKYDLLFDVNGRGWWFEYKRVLTPNARVVVAGGPRTPLIGPLSHIIQLKIASLGSKHPAVFFIANFTREDMCCLRDLVESGKVKPLVERVYPFNETAEAMRYLGEGHAQGKIVVRVREEEKEFSTFARSHRGKQ